MGIYDVPPNELVERVAEQLKQVPQLKPPEWARFVKTGPHRERPPVRNDWWYVRAASVLRKLAILGPIGVSKLRRKYGGRRNRGYAPEHHYPGSGSVTRKILQQLEKAGLAKQVKKGVVKGRVLTHKGAGLLEKTSALLMQEKGIVIPPEVPKAEKPKPRAAKPRKKPLAKKPRKPTKKNEQ